MAERNFVDIGPHLSGDIYFIRRGIISDPIHLRTPGIFVLGFISQGG
jgi:hypothetical protein